MKLNISLESVALAIFLFACIIIISLSPSGIIRVWVFSSAFEKYSSQRIRKIRSEHTIWQKMNLRYLIKCENPARTKKRVIAYWIYWSIVFLAAIMSTLSALGFFHHLVTGFIFFPLALFDIIIWVIWNQKGKKTL